MSPRTSRRDQLRPSLTQRHHPRLRRPTTPYPFQPIEPLEPRALLGADPLLTPQVLDFGGNDRVIIPNTPALNPSQITVETWVNFGRIGTSPDWQYLVCKGGDQTEGAYRLMQADAVGNGASLSFAVGPFLNWWAAGVNLPLQTHRWYHVAGTYDGDTVSLFVGGELVASNVVGAIPVGNDSPLYLSYDDVGGFPYYVTGQMDNVRIWSRALSQTEIRASMRSNVTGSEAGLAAAWNFDQSPDSQTILDLTPNGSNGQLGSTSGIDSDDPSFAPGGTLDFQGPHITSASPTGLLNVRTQPLTSLTVNFNEAIDFKADGTGSFTVDDIQIAGPHGPITPTLIDPISPTSYRINIPAQSDRGIYRVTVGPQITDLAANAMDQDQDGTPGEATDDAYTWSFNAYNADFTFTTPWTITAADKDYENLNIAVYATTLTIDGPHSFNSVVLINGAGVTHTAGSVAGLNLTTAEDVIIDATSQMNADGLGPLGWGGGRFGGTGPGAGSSPWGTGTGAGYGGTGGAVNGSVPVGPIYGSLTQPVDLGSGGGTYLGGSGWVVGGSGGGRVSLAIGRTLFLDGSLLASGTNGVRRAWGDCGGGGSGGSIYVTAMTVVGDGTVRADGGGGGPEQKLAGGGGGAGGRIALHADATAFNGTISAKGGFGFEYGGAGTIFTKQPSQAEGTITTDNGGNAGAATPLPSGTYTLDSLEVAGCAVPQLPTGNHTIDNIKVRSGANLFISAGVAVQFHHATVYSDGKLSIESKDACPDHPDDVLEIQKGGVADLANWTNNATILVDGDAYLQGPFNNNSIIAVTGSLVVRPPQDAIRPTYVAVYGQLRSGVLGKPVRIWTNLDHDADPDPKPYTAVGSFFNGYPNNPNLTSFAGRTVQKGDVLLKYTWHGDANLDGLVNADDYFLSDRGFITQVGGWYNGDFNYDAVVNADDYFLIDSAYVGQTGPLAAGLPQDVLALAQAQVKKDGQPSLLATLFSTEPML